MYVILALTNGILLPNRCNQSIFTLFTTCPRIVSFIVRRTVVGLQLNVVGLKTGPVK